MLNRATLYTALLSLPMLVACGGEQKKKEDDQQTKEPAKEEVCTYTYDAGQTSFKWTAFKFTEKVGVGGTFDSIVVKNTQPGENVLDVIRNLSFEIPITSVNSNNPDRDQKIQEHFFGTLNTTKLEGKVREISENGDGTGTLVMEIALNQKVNPTSMIYTVSGDTIKVEGSIDLANWDAQAGVDKLNEVCKDLHTGTDGKSVLWPEVKLEINSVMAKDCK